ncbi:hypothetical protein FLONG3_3722 [Fusarium longipes]|uniref:Interferon-induced 6-16 n=1 Tax=Fusarium longipes TaxID=694270 RepID=A0A395T082_9HYPO|nr:hypothetical protein FLONG3_3722 [Fusarium longipes]
MMASAKSYLFHAANSTIEYVKKNPGAAAAMGTASIMVVAPAVVAAPAIAAAGFGANGIAAASTAAGVHAGIGNAVAHSAFATLQSYGMAGYGVPIVHGIVQAAGAVVGAGTAYSGVKGGSKDSKKTSDGSGNSKGSDGGK